MPLYSWDVFNAKYIIESRYIKSKLATLSLSSHIGNTYITNVNENPTENVNMSTLSSLWRLNGQNEKNNETSRSEQSRVSAKRSVTRMSRSLSIFCWSRRTGSGVSDVSVRSRHFNKRYSVLHLLPLARGIKDERKTISPKVESVTVGR